MVKPIEEYSVSDLTLKKLNDDFYRCQGPMTLSDFPVNLEFLLIEILLFFFDHWSDQLFQNNQHFQAIEFLDQPVPEKLDMGFLFYGHEVLQVECADSQVQSYPYKHIGDTYVTLGWISTEAFLAPHVNASKF